MKDEERFYKVLLETRTPAYGCKWNLLDMVLRKWRVQREREQSSQ